jgi:hypothetical protein
MATGSGPVCENCRNPRIAGASVCPFCNRPYGFSLSGPYGNDQGSIATGRFQPGPTVPSPERPLSPTSPTAVPPPPGGYFSGPFGPPSRGPLPQQPAAGYMPPGGNPLPPPRRRSKIIIVQSIVILVLVIVVAGLLYGVLSGKNHLPSIGGNPSATGHASPTATPSNTYSASLPGPGCDTNGGLWTPQGIDGVSCPSGVNGTELVINTSGARGYLTFQLPGKKAFAPNNTINVTGTMGGVASGYQTKCVGLAEQTADTGYSVEYCNDGKWFVYSISSGGTVIQTLNTNVINALTTAEVSLTLQGTSLTLAVNSSVVSTTPITAIQPTKVAIVYDCVGYGASSSIGGNYLLVSSFNYAPLSS